MKKLLPGKSHISQAHWSEARIFAMILGVIFVADVAVLKVLPWLLPDGTNAWFRGFVDGGLLTLICAPILWRVVVDPLRLLATAERAKADVILRTAADGILTFCESGIIETFSVAAEQIFGASSKDTIGQDIRTFLPDWQPEVGSERIQKSVELVGCRRDGVFVPLEVSISHVEIAGRRLLTGIVRDVSERKWVEAELQRVYKAQEQAHHDLEVRVEYRTAELAQANLQMQRQSELLGSVLSALPHCVYWKNRDALYLGCNDNFAQAVGLETAQAVLGKTDHDFLWAEDESAIYRQHDQWVIDTNIPQLNAEETRLQADGTRIDILISRVPLRDADGQAVGLIGLYGDITERKQVEGDLKASEERLLSLVRNVSDIFAVLDIEGIVQYVSPAMKSTLGYSPEEVEGRSLFNLVLPEDQARAQHIFEELCAGTGEGMGEFQIDHADGTRRSVEMIGNNLLADPAIHGILVTFHDVTERKVFEEQLVHQAFHDALSGLPNRALFMDRLERAMARAERKKSLVAVIFLDLDNFKVINDSLGHEAGDRLLASVAERLLTCVRTIDTVARLGGDEFTVLLEDVVDINEVRFVADRIIEKLLLPVSILEREVFTSVSVGVAINQGEYEQPDDLLRDADTAMYQAKTSGKAQAITFERSMNTRAMERLELETDLRRAVENHEFCLHYQPIMSMETGKISGVEALVRWQHPQHGLISPAKFIPLAEETGMIVPIGRWVLEEACRQGCSWQADSPETRDWVISVNLSARQLQQSDLVEDVARVLNETGLAPEQLKLEITESVMMSDTEVTLGKLHALKALGVRLAVDDFGTGYSSMAYLSTLPIDTLKIDRSFINKIGLHAEGEAIVRTIVSLAKMLNLQVTSEGIETDEQHTYLQDLDCDWGQGYLFAHPLTEPEIGELLQERAKTILSAPPQEITRRAA